MSVQHIDLVDLETEDGEMEFGLDQWVQLMHSREKGIVIGASVYAFKENDYLVRYRNAAGCQYEAVFGESALSLIPIGD